MLKAWKDYKEMCDEMKEVQKNHRVGYVVFNVVMVILYGLWFKLGYDSKDVD